MALKLHAEEVVELAWWWEEPPAGRLLELRDVAVVRTLLGRWCGRAAGVAALRGFVAREEAWEVGRVGDGELMERVAVAVVRGRIRVAVAAREALVAWDGEEEEAVGEKVVRKEEVPQPVKKDICWPCLLRALASAAALKDASKYGIPFISNGPLTPEMLEMIASQIGEEDVAAE